MRKQNIQNFKCLKKRVYEEKGVVYFGCSPKRKNPQIIDYEGF